MDKIVVIGGGSHSKIVISILKKLNKFEIIGYTDIKNTNDILGVKNLGNDEIIQKLYNQNVKFAAMGIGMIDNFNFIENLVSKIKSIGLKFPNIISPHAIINEEVTINDGSVIMDGVVINSGSSIGKHCIINTKSSIDHDCKIGDFVHIAPGVTLCGGVEVNSYCLIGAGSTIIPYKKICKNCIIGSGSVVVKNCTKSGTYKGIPSKKVRK